jgi:hypothetical protein
MVHNARVQYCDPSTWVASGFARRGPVLFTQQDWGLKETDSDGELWSELVDVGLGNESGVPFFLVRRTSSGSGIPAKKGTPMLKIVDNSSSSGVVTKSDATQMLDEIALEGARAMLAVALEREVQTYVEAHTADVDGDGRRLVVRNGHANARVVKTAAGPIEVATPRVNDRRVDPVTGERVRFSSTILPPWTRTSPKVNEVLALMYLRGMSTGDFLPGLEQFCGTTAGLSPSTITRLTTDWGA